MSHIVPRGILRPAQLHYNHHHRKNHHVTFHLPPSLAIRSPQMPPPNNFAPFSARSSLAPPSNHADPGTRAPHISSPHSSHSSLAPPSNFADVGSRTPHQFCATSTSPFLSCHHTAPTGVHAVVPTHPAVTQPTIKPDRGRTTDMVLTWICAEIGSNKKWMFEGINASQLARVWIEARRVVSLPSGSVESRVARMLAMEEVEWKRSVQERRRRRLRARRELGRFVGRYVCMQEDLFEQLNGKDITRLVIKAVRMAIRSRRRDRL
eukprot:GFKZ01010687.1.p1 GENE.GFKZ01010687.1~~GFKZ01010687.1.p1  ORF type:complete len:288 (+),score=30.52 GFKZ01010687.1:75-866(+)